MDTRVMASAAGAAIRNQTAMAVRSDAPLAGTKRKRQEITMSSTGAHTDPTVERVKKVARVDASGGAGPVTSNWVKLQSKIASRHGNTLHTVSHIASTATAVSASAVIQSVAGGSKAAHSKSNPQTRLAGAGLDKLVRMGASFHEGGSKVASSGAAAGAVSAPKSAKIVSLEQMRNPSYKAGILGPFEDRKLSPFERRYMALDCEMVGVGSDGRRSELAQVVIVDFAGRVVYNKYVKPKERITDYRTEVSGIRPELLVGAPEFELVQKEVSEMLRDKVIVGHSLQNDLHALLLSHNWKQIRDTAEYKPFCYRNDAGKIRPRKLKHLCHQHLGIIIQEGEHEPAEDARAALALYRAYQKDWERSLITAPGTVMRSHQAGASDVPARPAGEAKAKSRRWNKKGGK